MSKRDLHLLGHVDVKSGALLLVDFGLVAAFGAPGAARAAADAAHAAGTSEIEQGGVRGVVVRDVPPGRYPVMGELVPSGEFEGLRRVVTIEIAPKKQAKRRVALGSIPVDMARIGAFDLDAVERWNEEAPADGKADIVFWGLHEEEVARRFQAPKLAEDEIYGFVDRPIAEASAIGLELHALREAGELRFAYDFRPHTHPYFLLAQIRASEEEAGVIDVGGYDVCGFTTTWGDGVFPVTVEVDDAGKPIRVAVFFATDDARTAMREVNDDDDDDEDDEDDDEEEDEDDE